MTREGRTRKNWATFTFWRRLFWKKRFRRLLPPHHRMPIGVLVVMARSRRLPDRSRTKSTRQNAHTTTANDHTRIPQLYWGPGAIQENMFFNRHPSAPGK
jgi:peptidoglycan/LPS O-acetylase OafA/YrhL